jgi:uncharacterized protein (DUF302 family)
MKKLYSIILVIAMAIGLSGCMESSTPAVKKVKIISSVQVFSQQDAASITPKMVSKAFAKVGLRNVGNNDMNKPFSQRFSHTHYSTYNLAMFQNDALTLALIKKYPKFGVLAPLSMSIWRDKKGALNISTLTLTGMARVANIPVSDPDLVAYAALVHKGLKAALPKGEFIEFKRAVKNPTQSFVQDFVADAEIDEDSTMEEFREGFEDEFEGELEPVGFLFPNYSNLGEDLFEPNGYKAYDFYITYSICKFDVIYPVSKNHPEAGAYAPCSFYFYKKKGEDKMHMGYLGVQNWIQTLDIKEQDAVKPLLGAQEKINSVIQEIIE